MRSTKECISSVFQVCCSLDYVQLMGLMAANDKTTQCLAEYICELGLLQSDFGIYPQAQVSASAILLARLAQKKGKYKKK